MNIKEILLFEVSYLDHFWTNIKDVSLKNVLDEIKGNKHHNITDYLRSLYHQRDFENYGTQKRKLPAVTFCASFEKERTKDYIKKYNFLIVIDIDKLGEEINNVKQKLVDEDYVFSFWESPSQDGIKGLVYLDYNFDIETISIDNAHKIAFSQITDYFRNKHEIELDQSGSDYTRLCFISCDKSLVLKDVITSFIVENKPIQINKQKKIQTKKVIAIDNLSSKDLLHNPKGRNNQYQRKIIKDIIKYLNRNSLSITKTYEEWLRVAFAISNSFTYDIGLKYFIELSKLDNEKFNVNECTNFLVNCYENSHREIGFNTIIHFATTKGFKYKNINAEST